MIGVSGGLDSTHALIVCARAMDRLGLPRSNVLAYTLPGFATSSATLANAHALMDSLGVQAQEATAQQGSLAELEGELGFSLEQLVQGSLLEGGGSQGREVQQGHGQVELWEDVLDRVVVQEGEAALLGAAAEAVESTEGDVLLVGRPPRGGAELLAGQAGQAAAVGFPQRLGRGVVARLE